MASTCAPSTAGHDSAKRENAVATLAPQERRGQLRKRVAFCLAILGLMFFAYLFGAAVIHFDLPTANFLRKAFVGARAWNERRQLPPPIAVENTPPPSLGAVDKPDKTFDGYTLYACASMDVSSTQAFLVDMRGQVVHRWVLPFSKLWQEPSHIRGPVKDGLVCFFSTYLYPNGDLLVVFHGMEQRANGYGLAKLDKDSNVIWKVARSIHHDVDVGEDGTIYAIAHKIVQKMPRGLEDLPTPSLVDELIMLSPDGKPIAKPIPILEAFRDSSYAPLLGSLGERKDGDLPSDLSRRRSFNGVPDDVHEPLHMNCVRVLPRRLAKAFPQFQPGHILFSMRTIDTIALLDPQKRAVVWAVQGPWRAQHDPQFLDNGNLLIFDNLGSARGSRVLEYNPYTQAFPWSYPQAGNYPMLTRERGMCQRLPNGNTLIVSSEQGKILEVTRERESVWSLFTHRFINSARRYSPEQVPFLPRGTNARP